MYTYVPNYTPKVIPTIPILFLLVPSPQNGKNPKLKTKQSVDRT